MSSSTTNSKPNVDYSKIQPLEHHRTAVTFNCIIMKMVEFLNNFGSQTEEVLERAEMSLDKADRRLRLMEVMLSDVHLEDENHPSPSKDQKDIPHLPTEAQEAPKATEKVNVLVTPNEEPVTKVETTKDLKPTGSQVVLIKDDPAYNKYFKMLKMGVPEAGVTQKMVAEGVDPTLLKRGDDPSNLQQPVDNDSSDDSVSSFSDSD